MGLDGWMATVLFDAPAAERIMDELTPFFARLVNNLFADGAAFAAFPCAFASPSIVPREVVSRLMRPALTKILARLNGPVVLHHGGAPLLAHLDLLAGLPPTVAYVVDAHDDLDQSRRIVGPDSVLFSGPSAPMLSGASVAQVEQQCRVMLENRRQDARFILSTTGPDIPYDTPAENIHALRQASESLGSWP
jgi:uroporphyrinogen decarboxylase